MQDKAFRYQYRISRQSEKMQPATAPPSRRQLLGGWTLELGSDLPLARLVRKDGSVFGLLFGIAVEERGALLTGVVKTAPDPAKGWDAVEQWVEGISGRFGVLMADGRETRFYCDPCGMIGAVYDPVARRLAASLALCLDRPVEDRDDYDHSAVAERGGVYTLFDTRDKTARRLNPSCYLSLETFTETRFWPRPDSIALVGGDLEHTYDAITAQTRAVMSAVAKAHRTWIALSGGQDSRLLLAMAGPAARYIESSFTHISNFMGRIDASIAQRMAEGVGIPHETHDRRAHKVSKAITQEDEATFLRAVGFPMRPPREISNGLNRLLPDGVVVFRGHQTDILRAVLADKIGSKARRRTHWQIKRLLPVPRDEFDATVHQRFHDRYEAWRRALPAYAEANSTDLMFLEIYYSSTIGCSFPGCSGNFFMSPFNGRRQIGHAMAIDETYRKASYSVFDLIARSNPVLEGIPFDFELGPDLGKLDCVHHVREVVTPRRSGTEARRGAPG
ncbi:hypothetical protein [Pseudotabrizicola algicola]|uniref:Asparagine synthetase domain-containing protein n=1 Tax=Pseudotabrizicola algicola TaxID=2709381 RepID=A0A6B3RI99_9RHOB|nr:hypothetical protein [Pseudotabrizicola algicola]NEX45141.1 hypothetical protein [Pseudotabrizicola algicola]